MKHRIIALTIALLASAAPAQTFVQHLKCELETASGSSLPPKTILQGTTPLWSLDQYRQGQAVAASTDGTIRAVVVLGQSATNGPWASITNYATSGYGYLVQFPVVGTNSGGATGTPWWYTVLYQSTAGKTYWSGSGRLTIEPTQYSGEDGLGWGASTNNYAVLIAAETAARIAADNALGVRIDNITIGPGLGTNDMLNVIASVVPTSRVAYAASAGTAAVATVALSGWPVVSVNGQTGAVVIATNSAFSGPYVATVNGQTGNVTVAASLPAGAVTATNQGVAGQSLFYSTGAPTGTNVGYWATAAGSGDMLKSEYDAGGVKQVAFTNDPRIVLALTNAAAFATAAQGAKADTALQPANTSGWVVASHAYLESGLSVLTTTVAAANATGSTHTAQIAANDAFRLASTVNYATNAGNAATVGGYTATQLLSQAGTIYYVWGSVTGQFTAVPTKMAQLSSPYAMGVWTSTVASVTNLMPLGYVSIKTNELPRFTVPGREVAHISIERTGNSQERTMKVCKSVYESDQVTLVSHVCGEAKAVPQGKDHLDFDLFETTETAITDNKRYIVYSFTTVAGWGGGETVKVYSQDGELTYISTAGGAGVFASQSALDAHTTNTNNPHATTAAQVGAVPTNDTRYLAALTNGQTNVVLGLASGTTVATATAGSEPATLDQVLSLLDSSSTLYLSPSNCTVCPQNSVTNRQLSVTPSATAWTIVFNGSVTNGAYLFSFVASSNAVSTVRAGNQTANLYMTHVGGGGSTLSCKMEGYVYNPATSNSTEYAETATSFSVAKSGTLPATPTTPIAVIPYETNLTGNLRYQIRVKAIAANNVTSVTMWGGGNSISSVSFPVADTVALGSRGATGIKDSLGNAGTYDSTARTLTTPALTAAGIAAAGGMTNDQPVTLAQLPSVVLTNGGTVAVAATNAQHVATNHVAQVGTAAHAGMLTNSQTGVTLTLIGGNAVTNGAIPASGCTDLGTAVNLVLSGATVAYVANPTGVYTVSVTKASASGYVYTLTTFSTNAYTLASGLQLYGSHTIGATNEFVFIPQTNSVYKVRAQKVQ